MSEQDWCLRCGAAARTRLAASPRWRGAIVALAVVVVLALGVLAAALVKLAGDSGSSAPASTSTVLVPQAGATSTQSSTAAGTPPAGTATGSAAAGATAPTGTAAG